MTATVRGVAVGEREGSADIDFKKKYTVTYYVQTDSTADGPHTVRQAFGIPMIGDVYNLGNDLDVRAVCTEINARERESPTEWEVVCTFTSRDQEDPNEEEENPLLQPAEISLSFQTRQKVLTGYYNDPMNPNASKNLEVGIVSSNGELFDPQPEIEIADPVLTIKKNMPYMSAAWLMSIANTVNFSQFYGADARQLRLMPPATERAYDQLIGFYWPTTFQFVYRYDTWDLQLLNAGTYYMFGGTRFPFQDKKGTPFVGLLDEYGDALNSASDDTIGRYISGGDAPTYSRLRIYREIDFNSLGII